MLRVTGFDTPFPPAKLEGAYLPDADRILERSTARWPTDPSDLRSHRGTSEFPLPDVGEGLTEAEIVSWKVKPGDTVTVNQVLVEIETAKSLVELPSPFAGTVDRAARRGGRRPSRSAPRSSACDSAGGTIELPAPTTARIRPLTDAVALTPREHDRHRRLAAEARVTARARCSSATARRAATWPRAARASRRQPASPRDRAAADAAAAAPRPRRPCPRRRPSPDHREAADPQARQGPRRRPRDRAAPPASRARSRATT